MTDSGDIIQLDDLAKMMLHHLQEHLKEEPEPPNGDEPAYLTAERAQLHEAWSRELQAIRLMLGIRLTSLALGQL